MAWLAGTRDGLAFLRGQFASIGIMAVPYALPGQVSIFEVNLGGGRGLFETQSLVIGIVVFAAGLAGLFRLRQQRLLMLTLLLAGWGWALIVPASVDVHDFEALFHIGIPLIFFRLLLRIISRLSDRRLLISLVLAALGIFVFASFQASRVGYDAAAAEFQGEVVADFQALRKVTAGQSVYLASREAYHNFAEVTPAALYYLAGHPISENPEVYRHGRLDYLIQPHREEGLALLTPENRRAFLYDRAQYSGDIDQLSAVAGEPVARADFDLYLSANRIIYVKEPCGRADRDSPVYAAYYSGRRARLAAGAAGIWFRQLGFRFPRLQLCGGQTVHCGAAAAQLPHQGYPHRPVQRQRGGTPVGTGIVAAVGIGLLGSRLAALSTVIPA